MARAFLLIRLTLVLVGASLAGAAAAAGNNVGDPGKRATTNTFNLITTAPPPGVRGAAAGASVAPRGVVSNPYNVPLIQNAGTLGAR